MSERRVDADKDGCLGAMLRSLRHPLRALTMATAAYCMIADVAMTPGVVATVLGACAGVLGGELLAKSKLRLPMILGGFVIVLVGGLMLGSAIRHFEFLVRFFGVSGSLGAIGLLHYGALSFTAVGVMRTVARRHPSWMALELAFVVAGVAAALAAHRGGVIARPLWLSDFAWRRDLDPADLLIGMGVAAALASTSLLLFERRGRLSLAALPLLPLVAMLAVSCLEVSGVGPDMGEASPDVMDEDGDAPEDDGENGESPGGSDGDGDGGADDPGGLDAGTPAPSGGDGGLDGSAGGGGADGGGGGGQADGGGGGGGGADGGDGGGGGGGDADGGGGGGGGGDGGADGGAGGGGEADGGSSEVWEGWDAGLDDSELPPPSEDGDGEGQSGGASDPDLVDQPPPTGAASAAPAALVLFEGDYSPPSEVYYFRQDAWSHFNGSRLVPTTIPEADRDIPRRYPTAGRVEMEPPPEGARQAVAARVALLVPHEKPFALESPLWLADARNPNPARFARVYRFLSQSQRVDYPSLISRNAGNPEWTDNQRLLYLQPHPDERFAEFAQETIDQMPPMRRSSPFARAVAIKLRLDSMLTYSTRERHADVPDPTVDFFFGNRIGYCVHFAHTAVYMYRAVGVPARIGVGYAAGEANRRGGSALLIRSGDAHAWPEIYLEGVGWVVLDISAHENLDPAGAPPDEDLQRLLGEMAREEPPDPEDEIADEDEPSRLMPSADSVAQALLWLFLLALVAILLALYAIKIWRRISPSFASKRSLARVSYRLALDRLAEVGISRRYGETREQFAARAAELSPAFEKATTLLLAHGFGPGDVASDPKVWAETRAQIGREVSEGTELWRRTLGVLHPLAFLDAR